MKKPISDAVVLMAGTGSRLRSSERDSPKLLLPVGGRPLISHVLDALIHTGVTRVHAVIGFESESLRTEVTALTPNELDLVWIQNRQWQKQNGISVLAAENSVTAPFFLTMGDHIFEPSILETLARNSNPDELNLAIDRKIDQICDLDDAMKVQTRGDRVTEIGKQLEQYDAIDTGAFVCPAEIFDYLRRSRHHDDCSLADGVRLMCRDAKVRAIDIGNAWWQDVDTPEMLTAAEKFLSGPRNRVPGGTRSSSLTGQNQSHQSVDKEEMQDQSG